MSVPKALRETPGNDERQRRLAMPMPGQRNVTVAVDQAEPKATDLFRLHRTEAISSQKVHVSR